MTNEEMIALLNQEAEKALLQVGYHNGRRTLALELAALLQAPKAEPPAAAPETTEGPP